MIKKTLDDIREQYADCELLAFADISAGMVLYTSTGAKVRQEKLDNLCATAVNLLSGSSATAAAENGLISDTLDLDTAMLLGGGRTRIFLRSASDDSEVVLAICNPEIDVKAFSTAIRDGLAELAVSQ